MRIQSCFFLMVLLALGSQWPAVAGWKKKGEKLGGCPPDDGPCTLSVPDQCTSDSQCPSTYKCCYRTCFRQCVPRVSVKRGNCPRDQLLCLSPTQHLCNQDSNCSRSKRCCPTACGRDCRDPTRGSEIHFKRKSDLTTMEAISKITGWPHRKNVSACPRIAFYRCVRSLNEMRPVLGPTLLEDGTQDLTGRWGTDSQSTKMSSGCTTHLAPAALLRHSLGAPWDLKPPSPALSP
ncbi:WAP four-disulfide core domain protein 5 [Thomomys bottae]